MKRTMLLLGGLALATAVSPALAKSTKPKSLNIAIVTFFSGSGGVVGGPTVDSAKIAIEDINKAGGINGVPIKAQYVDESGGATKQVAEFRSLAGKVDAVLGYVSSANCLAVGPVAEDLHQLTLFSGCDGQSLYKGASQKWIFHTIPSDASESAALAFYVAKMYPHLKSIAGINPDYAFGRDEWKYFVDVMKKVKPDVKIGTALFPALFSGHYTSELTRLMGERPDLIFSSNWGGDVVALIQQAIAQNAFQQTQFVLSVASEGGTEAMKALPDGVIGGDDHGYLMHPGKIENPEVAAFFAAYHKRTNKYPVSPYPFTIQRAIYALKAGYEAAIKANGGQWPNSGQVAHALVGVHVKTMTGPFEIRKDHVASLPMKVGVSVHSKDYPFAVYNKIIEMPPSLIQPPVGMDEDKWIASLSPASLKEVSAPREYH